MHTHYPSCRQDTGAQTFGKALQPSSLQAAALGGASRRCRRSEAFAWRAPLAPQDLVQAAPEPLACARCGKRCGLIGPHEHRQVTMAPRCVLRAAWPRVLAPVPAPASRLYACDEGGKAFVAALASTVTRRHSGAPPPSPGSGAEVLPAGCLPAGTEARGCLWLGEALGTHPMRACSLTWWKGVRGPGVRQGLHSAPTWTARAQAKQRPALRLPLREQPRRGRPGLGQRARGRAAPWLP